MAVNINVKVTSWGQIVFEMGKPSPTIESHPLVPVQEEVRYREPLESASGIYEVRYEEELTSYIVPLSTA